jgi:predicted nucleotidyltransferase
MITEELVQKIKDDKRIVSAYVHGSVAKGTDRIDSDLDISLICLPKTNMSSLDLLMLTEKLAYLSERELHLSILSHDNLIFLCEVVEHGKCLFTKDSFYSDMFTCTGLALAAKLKEDSREVINAYTA